MRTNAIKKNELIQKRGFCCERCHNSSWMGEPIPLEMHHINPPSEEDEDLQLLCTNCHALTSNYRGRGRLKRSAKTISDSELIEAVDISSNMHQILINLNLVAAGGNYDSIRKRIIKLDLHNKFVQSEDVSKRTCKQCGLEFFSNTLKFCSLSCSSKFQYKEKSIQLNHITKIDWPKSHEIRDMVKNLGFSETGRRLGVSDNAIRKRLKNHP